VLLKLDHLFPSGSYKDRGAAVLMSKVAELGIERVVEDSSGNAGAAIAAYAAAAGISADIYVPAANSPEKLAQIRSYGARLVPVEGSRSDTAAAAMEAAAEIYYASHVYNPFFIEGTKTFAYEVWEQLGYRAPDAVVLPAGNGTLLLGSYKGFSELKAAGLVERVPAHVAVQTAACAPLAAAVAAAEKAGGAAYGEGIAGGAFGAGGEDSAAGEGTTVTAEPTAAEGIAIASPPLLKRMAEAVLRTGGRVITVTEEEIVEALSDAVGRGIYIEPTAAASLAGLNRYLGAEPERDPEKSPQRPAVSETVVGVTTGHGLKAPGKIGKLLEKSGRS
jgi:threonine synthase